MPDSTGVCAVVPSTRKPLEVQWLSIAEAGSLLIIHLTWVQTCKAAFPCVAREPSRLSASNLCPFPLVLITAARGKKGMKVSP